MVATNTRPRTFPDRLQNPESKRLGGALSDVVESMDRSNAESKHPKEKAVCVAAALALDSWMPVLAKQSHSRPLVSLESKP